MKEPGKWRDSELEDEEKGNKVKRETVADFEQVKKRQRWRSSWQRLQSNQLFPVTPMLSSRLIGRVSL